MQTFAVRELVLSAIFIIKIAEICALNANNQPNLLFTEQNTVEQFKSQIWDNLSEDFMKSDNYLKKWLQKAKLNAENATNMLLQTISWRKNLNISEILQEDFFDFEKDYHTYFKGRDKENRPLLEINLGDWDLHGALVNGKMDRLQRYMIYLTERNLFRIEGNGEPVGSFVVLINAKGVNTEQHSCVICATFLAQWITEVDMFYPDVIHEIIIINAPKSGHIILDLLPVVVSSELNNKIRFFNGDKINWMQYLDSIIDKDQRSSGYGGTVLTKKAEI